VHTKLFAGLHSQLTPSSTKECSSKRIRRPSHRRRIRSIADGSGDAIKQPTGTHPRPSGYRQKNGYRWLGAPRNSFTFAPIERWPFPFLPFCLSRPTTKFTRMT